jgi:hypothetical protein
MSHIPGYWKKYCNHGKSLDVECLACAMIWRIDQRKDEQIIMLKARVAELEKQ